MQTVTGTYDVFGDELEKMVFLESSARSFFRSLGFEELRTPVIEYQEVFVKTLGELSDIVMHQMYSFEDKDGKAVVLRPEGTAPAVRFYVERLCHQRPRSKVFYIGPMFRRERPQRGRQRQFHQIGCEMFGFGQPEADAYLIYVGSLFLRSVGVEHTILLNSVGCPTCRPRYSDEIRRHLKDVELCPDCLRRRERNPLRVLDCKVDASKLEEIPLITDFWCDDCRSKFEQVSSHLSNLSVSFTHDPRLVRGLDYYTGVVFEFYHPSDQKNAMLAGGRYDFLVEFMGGKPTPSCGFAMGVERVVRFTQDHRESGRNGVFIAYTQEARDFAFSIFKMLSDARLVGPETHSSDVVPDGVGGGVRLLAELSESIRRRLDINLEPQRGLRSQMRHADRENYRFVLIVGREEVEKEGVSVRDLEGGDQHMVFLRDFRKFLGI